MDKNDDDDQPSLLWVPCPNLVWRLASILSLTPSTATVSTLSSTSKYAASSSKSSKTETFPRISTHAYDPSHSLNLDDLSRLNDLHEAPLMHGVKARFERSEIYTNCGDVLLSVNPYKVVRKLYDFGPFSLTSSTAQTDPHEMGLDSLSSSSSSSAGNSTPSPTPHVYTTANNALTKLLSSSSSTSSSSSSSSSSHIHSHNQSILISGESGSGKTEASKYVMRYLIHQSNAAEVKNKNIYENKNEDKKKSSASVLDSLISTTLLLETFGNAKTTRNDNSSRFGKYITLRYDKSDCIVSSKTEHFLLEKSRIVDVDYGERNYHFFYQLAAGVDSDTKKQLNLKSSAYYNMLNKGQCYSDKADAINFKATCESLALLNITPDLQFNLFKVITAILQLGNLEFEMIHNTSGSEAVNIVIAEENVTLSSIASLLGLNVSELELRLTVRRSVSGRGSVTEVPLDEGKARDNVNALIKYVYSSVFEYMVLMINLAHGDADGDADVEDDVEDENVNGEDEDDDRFIGILDIFGFEVQPINSFSQLCINYTNETLQRQFNHSIFLTERHVYESEGLDSSSIKYKDNQGVIDLIGSVSNGLFRILEEHCFMSKMVPNNTAFLQAVERTHASNEHFMRAKFGQESFVVCHFAGKVEYDVEGFIEKNNDRLGRELLDLVCFSSNSFLSKLIRSTMGMNDNDNENGSDENENDGDAVVSNTRKKGFSGQTTVSSLFRTQLQNLTSTLQTTSPHYIKCIKPNDSKRPGGFDNKLVIEQLRYSGVLEVVRIRREGFPTRVDYYQFHLRYSVLLFKERESMPKPEACTDEQNVVATKIICSNVLDVGDYQFGKNKLFLRDDKLRLLSLTVRFYLGNLVTKIVARLRGRLVLREYRRKIKAVAVFNAVAVMMRRKRVYREEKELFEKIRAYTIKRNSMRIGDKARIEAGDRIAASWRMRVQRRKYLQEKEEIAAVSRIAGMKRMLDVWRDYKATIAAVNKIASILRMHSAKSNYDLVLLHKLNLLKHKSIMRIQSSIRSYCRNARDANKIISLHVYVRNGDINKVNNALNKDPSLKRIKYRYDHFKTLLHTACKTGNVGMVKALRPKSADVYEVDSLGNSALHYSAGSAKLELVVYLSEVINLGVGQRHKESRASAEDDSVRSISNYYNSSNSNGNNSGDKLMEGWMRKHKEKNNPERRWCVVTSKTLQYYKKESDKKPIRSINLELAMVKYSHHSEHSFEVYSPNLVDKKNPVGRMYFACESDGELQLWLAALVTSDATTDTLTEHHDYNRNSARRSIGNGNGNSSAKEKLQGWLADTFSENPYSRNSAKRGSAKYIISGSESAVVKEKTIMNATARSNFIKQTNHAGRTALHFLAMHDTKEKGRFLRSSEHHQGRAPSGKMARSLVNKSHVLKRQDTTDQVKQSEGQIVAVAAYLVENGCGADEQDVDGFTALRFAVQAAHLDLAAALVKKGANISLKGRDGMSAIDMLTSGEDVERVCRVGRIGLSELPKLKGPPVKTKGCHYLSFFVEKLSSLEFDVADPYFKVTVYTTKPSSGFVNTSSNVIVVEEPQVMPMPMVTSDEYLYWGSTWNLQSAVEEIQNKSGFAILELCKKSGECRAWVELRIDMANGVVDTGEVNLELMEAPVDLKGDRKGAGLEADMYLSGQMVLTMREE